MTAPNTFPIPPRTAATKAFRPGHYPHQGIDLGIFHGPENPAGRCQGRTQRKSQADDPVYRNAHQRYGFHVPGNRAHGQTDPGPVEDQKDQGQDDQGDGQGPEAQAENADPAPVR